MIRSLAAVASFVPDFGSAIGWLRDARGASFLDEPRREALAVVAVFLDARGGQREASQTARQGGEAAS